MASVLYWIHLPEHTDMFTQGYIGITNNFKNRLEAHKNRPSNKHLKNAINKYGWDSLVKQIILVADEAYCLVVEHKLRIANSIGWNIVEGGGKPPVSKKGCNLGRTPWNKGVAMTDEAQQKLSAANKGRAAWNKDILTPEEVRAKQRIAKLGKPSPRKGIAHTEETKLKIRLSKKGKKLAEELYKKQGLTRLGKKQPIVVCPHCNKKGGNATMPRWHFDNCKEYK